MGSVQQTKWECRRCKCEETVDGLDRPMGWLEVSFAMFPNAEYAIREDLCGSCCRDLIAFLNGFAKEAIEAEAAKTRQGDE